VAIADVDTGAGRGDRDLEGLDPLALQAAQDLAALALDLGLLVRDVGDHVVEDVEGRDAGAATGARHGLERGHHHRAQAEAARERGERDHQTGGGTVRDRRHEALPAPLPLLALHENGVLEVHAGNQDGYVVLSGTPRGRVTGTRAAKALLERARRAALDRREDQVDAARVEPVDRPPAAANAGRSGSWQNHWRCPEASVMASA
jgi:hypothetical protein